MVTSNTFRKIIERSALGLAVVVVGLLSGCAPSRQARLERAVAASAATSQQNPPGVVNYIWEEPMVDVVEVPPGLDPDGVYYRPAHQAVVEVRQGRWKYLKEKAGN